MFDKNNIDVERTAQFYAGDFPGAVHYKHAEFRVGEAYLTDRDEDLVRKGRVVYPAYVLQRAEQLMPEVLLELIEA